MTVTNKYTKYWDQAINSCRDFVSSPTSNQQWYLVEQHDNCNPIGTSTGQTKDPHRDDISRDFNYCSCLPSTSRATPMTMMKKEAMRLITPLSEKIISQVCSTL